MIQTIKIWNVNSGECLRTLKGHTHSVRSLIAMPDGKIISCGDKTVKIWNTSSGDCLNTILTGARDWTDQISILPNGNIIVSMDNSSVAGSCEVWDINRNIHLGNFDYPSGTLFVLPNGLIVSNTAGNKNNTINVWSIDTGKCLQSIVSQGYIQDVALSLEGDLIIASTARLYRWEMNPLLKQASQAENLIAAEVPECKMM